MQAFLTTDPRPIGGPWFVLAVTAVMAAYNIPAAMVRRLPSRALEPLTLITLTGDFLVCTAWTLLNANDVYSTTYAIYTLVAIEAAVLYQWRGTTVFIAGFIVAYAALYWERAHFFGFPVVTSSILYRSMIVLMVATFTGAITSQSRRLRRAADREAKRYERLLASMSDLGQGVVIVEDQRVVYANDAFCRLSGHASNELCALASFQELIGTEAGSMLADPLPPAEGGLASGSEGEAVLIAKDLRRIHIDWAAEQIEAEGRHQVVIIVRDATERRDAIQLVKEARDAAEAASQAKSEHLSRMSHELRTPLTAILGYAELLEMELPLGQRAKVQAILAASDHLIGLVNDVLDISRASAGHGPDSLEPVNVAEVVTECISLLRPSAHARRITIRFEPAASGRYALADRKWLHQILLNLLSNAVNYNRERGKVVISLGPGEGGSVRLTVSDTGLGIEEKDHEALWQPFERLGAERTTVQGTGIGLSLCRRLVEAMGGTIGVTSRLGAGSTFWVELPASSSQSKAASAPAERPSEERPAADSADTSTVLFVEDDLSTVELMADVFRQRPAIRFLAAMDGRTALEMTRKEHPDLVILDLHLPDLDGEEVLRLMKNDPLTAELPVMILSADASRPEVERLIEMGAECYVTKPIRVREFLDLLDRTLGSDVRITGATYAVR